MNIDEIKNNLVKIHKQMALACQKAQRDPRSVQLEMVTKGVETEILQQLPRLGCRLFGENRIKQTLINKSLLGEKSEIHMIGHLDRNDAKKAVELYDLIESVDSLRIAEKLNFHAQKQKKILPIFLQLKTDCQLTKHGFAETEFLIAAEAIRKLPNLTIGGLMTLPPLAKDPQHSRPYFRKLQKIKKELGGKLGLALPYLSMGTSQDFEVAIEEGANLIRLGRSIFGFPTAPLQ